jgi:hypothetical protein
MRYQTLLTNHLIEVFETYLTGTGRGEATTARRVARDTDFLKRVRAGANFTVKNYDTITANLAVIWPPDLLWPDAVPLPDLAAASITPDESDAKWQTKQKTSESSQ